MVIFYVKNRIYYFKLLFSCLGRRKLLQNFLLPLFQITLFSKIMPNFCRSHANVNSQNTAISMRPIDFFDKTMRILYLQVRNSIPIVRPFPYGKEK